MNVGIHILHLLEASAERGHLGSLRIHRTDDILLGLLDLALDGEPLVEVDVLSGDGLRLGDGLSAHEDEGAVGDGVVGDEVVLDGEPHVGDAPDDGRHLHVVAAVGLQLDVLNQHFVLAVHVQKHINLEHNHQTLKALHKIRGN